MEEFVEDLLDNNELGRDLLDSLDDDALLRELVRVEMEREDESFNFTG